MRAPINMKFTITINMDNAAFEDGNAGPECARILRDLADECDTCDMQPGPVLSLRDVNGNTVGEAVVKR